MSQYFFVRRALCQCLCQLPAGDGGVPWVWSGGYARRGTITALPGNRYRTWRAHGPRPDCTDYNARSDQLLDSRKRERFDGGRYARSEEHTSELQSLTKLVCRLL